MSYYFKTEKLLLEKFNIANKLNLLPEHVKFTNPRPADSVDITMSKVYNTAIDMVMQPGAPFSGLVTIYYNRVDLKVEFGNAKLSENNYINIDKEKTIHEALDAINSKLGTRFIASELNDGELPQLSLLIPAQLRVTPDSLEYVGAVDVTLFRSTAKRITLDYTPVLFNLHEQCKQAVNSINPPVRPLYLETMHRDYTSAKAFLSKLRPWRSYAETNTAAGVEFRSAGRVTEITNGKIFSELLLDPIDGLGWYSQGDQVKDTVYASGTVCIYNGPTENCWIPEYFTLDWYTLRGDMIAGFGNVVNPANLKFKNVAVVSASGPRTKVGKLSQVVLLHYN